MCEFWVIFDQKYINKIWPISKDCIVNEAQLGVVYPPPLAPFVLRILIYCPNFVQILGSTTPQEVEEIIFKRVEAEEKQALSVHRCLREMKRDSLVNLTSPQEAEIFSSFSLL